MSMTRLMCRYAVEERKKSTEFGKMLHLEAVTLAKRKGGLNWFDQVECKL